MCKNSIINIRVSADEKENANIIASKLGYKNLSNFFRDYIKNLDVTFNDNRSLGFNSALLKYQSELLETKDPYKKYIISQKINLLNSIKNDLD